MDSLIQRIWDNIKEGLIEGILERFGNIFDMVNREVGEAAVQIGRSPADWNPVIFNMIRNLSETVIIPIAGIILTFVLCYELITMIINSNNMPSFETVMLYKWLFKTFIAIFILTNTFDIVMAVFDIAQHVVNESAGLIGGDLDVSLDIAGLEARLQAMGVWELIGLWLEMTVISLCMGALSIAIFIVVWGRMIEIYLTVSIAPIPFSTMANQQWGQIGNNYLKALFAVGFQGFLMMVCIAIYAALVAAIPASPSIHAAVWGTVGYTTLLFFALLKTGSLSKNLFGTH